MLVLLLVLVFCSLAQCQVQINPNRLGCRKMFGNYAVYNTLLERPMQPGDKVIVNGTVGVPYALLRINLVLLSGPIIFHYRNDGDKSYTIYNTFNGAWQNEEHVRNPYHAGQNFETVVEFTGAAFNVYNNGGYVYSYRNRLPGANDIISVQMVGSFSTNWIQYKHSGCTTPPVTRRPRRPRRGDGGRGRGGRGGRGSARGSSSDSSDSDCDE